MNIELVAILLAAATGALMSSIVTSIAQTRERSARQRELLFAAAIDISKSWIRRTAKAWRSSNAALSEVVVVELTYAILTDIFKHGRMSDKSRTHLIGTMERANGADRTPGSEQKK
jgi:hypothetical protein